MNKLTLSVIIPTLNEEKHILKAIESARLLKPDEIIVVDGGSKDNTVEIARECGVKVIISKRGRGVQLQKGADFSFCDVLLFLHADGVVTRYFDVRGVIESGYIGGFFRLKFDDQSMATRLVEIFANKRSTLFSLPYGDQAIFVKRDVFNEMGGFKQYPFLEDIDLVLRLRKKGKLFAVPVAVLLSARRIKKTYPLSSILVSLRNVLIVLLFLAGASPKKLIKLYK